MTLPVQCGLAEARRASQVYADTMRRLTAAKVLGERNMIEIEVAEHSAHVNYRRAMRELNH